MKRREMLATMAGMPALAGLSASAHIEAETKLGDLVIIECDDPLSQDVAERIKAHVQREFPAGQRVLVLDSSLKLRVERGIAKVELPK